MGAITSSTFKPFAPWADAKVWVPILDAQLTAANITGKRLCFFMAQAFVESGGFTQLEENLNYNASRLMAVWPHRFPTLESATPFAHNPKALADKTYGGRNGNTSPDDGYKYRGRGLFQTTFKWNYEQLAKHINQDVVANPDLLSTPSVATTAAIFFWNSQNLSPLADADEFAEVTIRINGGTTDMQARLNALRKANSIWATKTAAP